MAVNENGEKYLDAAASVLKLSEEEIKYVKLLDIFITKDGEKVQPEVPVSVEIKLLDKKDQSVNTTFAEDSADNADSEESGDATTTTTDDADISMQVVHFGEKGPEELTCENKEEVISFDTNGFSVYAIVGTETITTKVITASGETYEISVTYGADAEIPNGASLKAEEILEGGEEYESY